MREIKFRAWDKKRKNMLLVPTLYFNDTNYTASTVRSRNDFMALGDEAELMQYTGLKDKNGKEIYESDKFEIDEDIKTVVFEDGMFLLNGNDEEIHDTDPLWCYRHHPRYEIIGNKFEGVK